MTTHSKPLVIALGVMTVSAAGLAYLAVVRGPAPSASQAPYAAPTITAAAAAAAAREAPELEEAVELGKHLVSTSGCHDCHTPWKLGAKGPEPDMSRALSGHPEGTDLPPPPDAVGPWVMTADATNTAWSGPWGVSFTANLTPDKETGTGSWTKEDFIQTIRTGRHLGRGRPILPPMPVPVYQNFSDRELGAIYAYLQSIPAVKNRVRAPLPPKPAKTKPAKT